MIKQIHWRVTGGIAIAGCALLAYFGVKIDYTANPIWFLLGYWALFVLLFVVSIYCVLLDIRYIRAEYAVMKREIFRDTLGGEEMQRILERAREEAFRREESQAHSPDREDR